MKTLPPSTSQHKAIGFAILAAFLYALSTPLAKLLLQDLSPLLISSLLYLGAGLGMGVIALIRLKTKSSPSRPFTKKELPSILGMIVLDILAPFLLITGLNTSLPEHVALLNNFEIVATSLIAFFLFKELIPKRLRLAIMLITLASVVLTIEDVSSFTFSIGSIFVLLAAASWGLENNLTRGLSLFDPLMVVVIKGIFSGLGSLILAITFNHLQGSLSLILLTLLLGFFSYGLSIFFYVTAQKELGAAKTSAFYAFTPFISAFFSLILFFQLPSLLFFIALLFMGLGTYMALTPSTKTTTT